MCVPFYYMDTYKFVGKSYIPEDNRKCNLCHQSIKTLYFILFYSFWYMSCCSISFSKGVSDSVEIHGHILILDKYLAHLAPEMFLPESSLGPSGRSVRVFPHCCHRSWDLRSSLWLLTPGIFFSLQLCLLFCQIADRPPPPPPTQFPWWEAGTLLGVQESQLPPSALGPWAAHPVSLVLLPSPQFGADFSVCSLGSTLVLSHHPLL